MTDFSSDIDNCLTILRNGGIILYPTDTIWGIGCDATNEKAVDKIYTLKKRPDNKSMIVLLSDQKDVLTYVTRPDLGVFDFLKKAEKPTTVIYDGAINLADNIIAVDRTIAIRITADIFCKQLIKYFRKPIVSTSANISGYTSPLVFTDIEETIKQGVDYIVQYRQDDIKVSRPSSIIRWRTNGEYTVIRS